MRKLKREQTEIRSDDSTQCHFQLSARISMYFLPWVLRTVRTSRDLYCWYCWPPRVAQLSFHVVLPPSWGNPTDRRKPYFTIMQRATSVQKPPIR